MPHDVARNGAVLIERARVGIRRELTQLRADYVLMVAFDRAVAIALRE
jgi:hypothetical protein